MTGWRLAILLCLTGALPAAAAPPIASPHPQSRPAAAVATDDPQNATESRSESFAFLSPALSLKPWPRPPSVEKQAMAKRKLRRQDAVCGDAQIQGETVGHVPGRIKACGIRNAVRVKAVAGVRLNPPALMTCSTASALRTWTEKGLKPAFRRRGPVVEMKVAAHYACRTRNNVRGARISEHGKGNAIDLSAFTMLDGEVITVAKGWGRGTTLRPLRKAYQRGCGIFGTTLGPGSDGYHRDHFHFDTASYRSGSFCR